MLLLSLLLLNQKEYNQQPSDITITNYFNRTASTNLLIIPEKKKKKKLATVLTKFRKHKIFSSKSSPIDVKRHKQSVFTNTIYPSVSDATPAKRDRYEYKEEFAGAGRRRKIRSRTSTRTSLGVHIVTNEYFPSSGIQTAHWPSPRPPALSPPLHVQTHSRGWRGSVHEMRLPQCLENVSRTYAILPPPPRVVVRSVVPPPLTIPFLRFARSGIVRSVSLAPVPLYVFSSLSAVSTFLRGEKRTETRCRLCRPDCACFLAETRHNAPRTAPQRWPTCREEGIGRDDFLITTHAATSPLEPSRQRLPEALNRGPLSIRCRPRMGPECSRTLLKHVL